MIWNIAEISASIAENLIIVDFISRYLKFKDNRLNWLKALLCAALSMINSVLGEEYIHSEIITAIALITIMLLYSIIFLDGSIWRKIFIVSVNCLIILTVNTLMLTIFGAVFNADFNELSLMRNPIRIALLATTKFLYFMCTRLLLQLERKNESALSSKDWLGVLGMFVITLTISVTIFEAVWKQKYDEIMLSVFAVGITLINLFTYILLRRLSAEYKEKIRTALLELQLSEQKERIKTIGEMYNEILQIRHDVRKCLNFANVLIQQGKINEAQEYLSEISSEKLGTITEFVSLNSSVVSAVINSKLSQCKEEGLKIELGTIEYSECFSETDISMLLANLFDNAIEACRKTEEKQLGLKMEKQLGYLKIFMVNSVNEEAKNNSQLKTTKKDKKNHGFGLKTIRSIVKKYDGIYDLHFEKDKFIADVWLKIS